MRTIHTSLATSALLLVPFTPLASAQDEILRGRTPIAVEKPRAQSTFSRDMLPVDTGFVVHVDVQGLMGSIWWKTVNDATGLMDEVADDDDFARMRKEFGIDPFKDILAVTVVGHEQDGDDAVVVLHTTDRVDKALDKIRGMTEYRTTAHDGLELETWSDDGDDAVHALVVGRRDSTSRRIVVGQDPDRVVRTVRTMLGQARSLADVDRPQIHAQPKKGSYFYLEVGLPIGDLLEDTPASHIASKAKRFTVDVGEKSESVYLAATVHTAKREDARDIADVVNGARSMIALSGVLEQIPVAFSEVLEDARAELDGNAVTLSMSISTRDLREGLEELQQRR